MTPAASDEVRDVHLLDLPVRLWARANEQSDELLREFALISLGAARSDHADVPTRLTAVVTELDATYGGMGASQEELLFQAVRDGRLVLDEVVYTLPVAAGPGAQHLGDLLDEADAYCAAGEHLLTMAADPEVVRFRQWFLGQIVDQLQGAAAVSWSEWSRSAD